MLGFLLDTNMVSYLLKDSSPALAHRVRRTPALHLCVSTITEAELRYGIAHMPPEARMRSLVAGFLTDINIRPWDSGCAQHYAEIAAAQVRVGKPLSNMDTMIAAHALALDLTLVTHDKAFQKVKHLRLEDWTQGPHPA